MLLRRFIGHIPVSKLGILFKLLSRSRLALDQDDDSGDMAGTAVVKVLTFQRPPLNVQCVNDSKTRVRATESGLLKAP